MFGNSVFFSTISFFTPPLPPFLSSSPPHLVCINIDHFLEIKREQHVQEEDLIGPDHTLLLRLSKEPTRPFVGHLGGHRQRKHKVLLSNTPEKKQDLAIFFIK